MTGGQKCSTTCYAKSIQKKIMKSDVGMAVLKKQTNNGIRDSQHIRIVHPHACFSHQEFVHLFTDTAI